MALITFIYGINKFNIKIRVNDSFLFIINKYCQILNEDMKKLFFLYKGKDISLFQKNLLNQKKKYACICFKKK